MLIKDLFEAKGKVLKINLNKQTVSGDKSLFNDIVFGVVDEVDADGLEDNSDGNLDGSLMIWMGDASVEIAGENFSPLFSKFDTLSDKKQKTALEELKEKIKQEMPSIS